MKRIITFGPLAAIAIFAMALLGPSLAMGESTELCEADESPCASPVSHIHYVDNDLHILTSVMDYECKVLFLGTVNKLGSPQAIEGNFVYTSCNQGCEREELSEGGTLYFLKTGHESGEVPGGGVEIWSHCGSFINCTYLFEGLVGQAKGPLLSAENNGEIVFSEQTMVKAPGGLFCPKTAKLDTKLVPLSPTYISS